MDIFMMKLIFKTAFRFKVLNKNSVICSRVFIGLHAEIIRWCEILCTRVSLWMQNSENEFARL